MLSVCERSTSEMIFLPIKFCVTVEGLSERQILFSKVKLIHGGSEVTGLPTCGDGFPTA